MFDRIRVFGILLLMGCSALAAEPKALTRMQLNLEEGFQFRELKDPDSAASPSVVHYLPVVFLLVASLISWARLYVFQRRLFDFLLENHPDKWTELTTVLSFGPGYANSRRTRKFLFSKDDLDDPEVLRLKVTTRNSYLCAVTGFAGTFLLWVLTVALTVGLKFK